MINTEAFDEFAIQYDNWFKEHHCASRQELKAIKEFLPRKGKGLEIGAGTGRFLQPLRISLGIEPSENMRAIASKRGANIIAGTAESLPVGNGLYDYVLLVTTVCFLDSPEIAFRETNRVLKEKGLIIVGLIDKESKLAQKYEQKKNKSRFYKEANFHSVMELKEVLEETGFAHIEYVQAILPEDTDAYEQEVKQGYGEGSFVVMRAQKKGTWKKTNM